MAADAGPHTTLFGLEVTDDAGYTQYRSAMAPILARPTLVEVSDAGVVASMSPSPKTRAETFCARHGLRVPLLLAPMAGACPPELSIAVARGGGMGAMGARRHDKPGNLAKRSKSDAGFPSAPGLRGTEE